MDDKIEKSSETLLIDVGTQTLSLTSVHEESRLSFYDSKLELTHDPETDMISFPQWHQRMQKEHVEVYGAEEEKLKFSFWDCCNTACAPCIRADSIDYNKNLCASCFKYRTCKSWTTGVIIATFAYLTLYALIGEDALPWGTHFYLMVMFVLAFLAGIILANIGLPTTVGHLLVGIAFANLPIELNENTVVTFLEMSEKVSMVIILIRAALELDLVHIHRNVRIIAEYALVPYGFELVLVLMCGHYMMGMPWAWSALLGTILVPVSLPTVVSILEKNKKYIAVKNKKLSNVLIAASSTEIIISLYTFSVIFAVIFSKGVLWISSWWALLIAIIIQIAAGILIGALLGIVAGMFPDRRCKWAPYSRIVLVGLATIALVVFSDFLGMSGVGVLSSLTMVFVANNIWEEMGWHENTNPVLYFYSLLYFFIQPILISLVGLSMSFKEMEIHSVGISIATILIGVTGRQFGCALVSMDKSLPTSLSEKIFICISWSPKGAIEALLGVILIEMVKHNYQYVTDPTYTLEELLKFAHTILQTITLGILVTSPMVSLLTTHLTPRLFKQ